MHEEGQMVAQGGTEMPRNAKGAQTFKKKLNLKKKEES